MIKKIVVAYSGGLDTSVMIKWLAERYDAEIITVTGVLGASRELDQLEQKALSTGAKKAIIKDLREEFIMDYAFKSLKAGALYENVYPLATAVGRPLLVKLLVDIALEEGADTIAHGCTGKGNDQVRFETGIQSLAPGLNILAPLRTWEFRSREAELDYAIKHNIPVSVTRQAPYSIDENLWGTAIECGILEDLRNAPPGDAYRMTADPAISPSDPDIITIGFESGIPIEINGVNYSPSDLVNELNILGGKHGIGRIDMVENRVVGIKSREIYEAPAAVILHKAHYEIEKLVLDRNTFRYKQNVANKIANLIYDGLWFTPLFNALMSFVESTQEHISGEITLELLKGNVRIISRYAPFSLYDKALATYSDGDIFDHHAAEGFLKLYGLPYKTIAALDKVKVSEAD